MIGASIVSAIGKTSEPQAARLRSASGRRATTAENRGSSAPMSSQLAASGHHRRRMERAGSGAGETIRSDTYGLGERVVLAPPRPLPARSNVDNPWPERTL